MIAPRPPRFYFSFRSPYSWLAARVIGGLGSADRDGISYIPFWEPDEITLRALHALGGEFLYTPMSRAKHLYILEDIRRLATSAGVRYAWPIDVNPWWELPHLAYFAARGCGKGREFFDAAYRARWEHGRNICDERTIADIGAEIGAPPGVLVGAPNEAEIRRAGAEALYECYRDGVFGVPFFVHRREKFWGVDRLDAFIRALGAGGERDGRSDVARRQPPALIPAAGEVGGADVDHAGGCG